MNVGVVFVNIYRNLSFGDEHGAVMVTTTGDTISCYLLASAFTAATS